MLEQNFLLRLEMLVFQVSAKDFILVHQSNMPPAAFDILSSVVRILLILGPVQQKVLPPLPGLLHPHGSRLRELFWLTPLCGGLNYCIVLYCIVLYRLRRGINLPIRVLLAVAQQAPLLAAGVGILLLVGPRLGLLHSM